MRRGAGETLAVEIPPARSDVLHAVDVAEDVAIAFGFNNIATRMPRDATAGRELPLNQLTELLRIELASAGFTEILTWALCSRAENFSAMRAALDGPAVEIGNPATQEFQARPAAISQRPPVADLIAPFKQLWVQMDAPPGPRGAGGPMGLLAITQVARTALLPSALKTLSANRDAALPVRLFEVSDVVLLDAGKAVGARNERRAVAVVCDRSGGFELVHGLLMRVMQALGVRDELSRKPDDGGCGAPRCRHRPARACTVPPRKVVAADCLAPGRRFLAARGPDRSNLPKRAFICRYSWRPCKQPEFFPGRQADVVYRGHKVGHFGAVHPDVLAAFDIAFPVSALELNIEPFCFDQRGKSLLDVSSNEV